MSQKRQLTNLFPIARSKGIRISWIAEQLGMNRTVLYQVNWGERPMPETFIADVARLLGVTEDELLFLPSDFRDRPISFRSQPVEVPA